MIISIENFLQDFCAKKIYQQLSSPQFPWSYYTHVIFNDQIARSRVTNIDNFTEELPCFRHTFYTLTPSVKSSNYDLIEPIVTAIKQYFSPNTTVIESVYGNLMLQNPLYTRSALAHVDRVYSRSDYLQHDTYTGLYYLNTCDAETVLYNEHYDIDSLFPQSMTEYQRIRPEYNKLVLWDSRRFHSSPACGDTSRFLVNLNFSVTKQ